LASLKLTSSQTDLKVFPTKQKFEDDVIWTHFKLNARVAILASHDDCVLRFVWGFIIGLSLGETI